MSASDALYATPEFIGYSLWLAPHASAEKEIGGEIEVLATRLETPPFIPHATLLGAVLGMTEEQVMDKTKRVADGLRALEVEISVVSSKDLLYFQCVFALLHLSEELCAAHRFAMQVFDRTDEPEFMPHISLVYGDLSSADRKALAQELGPRFDGTKMTLDRLQVWNTTGPVKNWRLINEFPLTTPGEALKN